MYTKHFQVSWSYLVQRGQWWLKAWTSNFSVMSNSVYATPSIKFTSKLIQDQCLQVSRSQINLLVGRGIEFRFRIWVNHRLVRDRVKVTDWISFSLTGMFFSPQAYHTCFFLFCRYLQLFVNTYLWLFLSKSHGDWQLALSDGQVFYSICESDHPSKRSIPIPEVFINDPVSWRAPRCP